MKKKSLCLKLFCLLLIFGMVVGCFSGCASSRNQSAGEKDNEVDNPRDGLIAYQLYGLRFYLGEGFADCSELNSIYYFNEDKKIGVSVSGGMAENNIHSAEEWLEANSSYYDQSATIVEKDKANGTPYIYCVAEEQGVYNIVGSYFKDGYHWTINVRFEDANQREEAIKYATLGEIISSPVNQEDDKPEDSPDEDVVEPPVEEKPVEPALEQITLSIWTSDQDQREGGWLLERLEAFELLHPEYDIIWDLQIVGEGDVINMVERDPASTADVYSFPNDQMEMLIQHGVLSKLDGKYLEQVQNDNTAAILNTVTYTDGNVYAFPMTSNTWFMYYNKDTYTEEDIKSLDTMLEKGKVAMQLETAWYIQSFFTANGCTIFGENGIDVTAGIQFGGEKGYGAAEAMVKYTSNPNFLNCEDGRSIARMCDGTIDAMFSGWWDYELLHSELGDKLGCAVLPTVTISGKQVQLKAFAGSKGFGVNPNSDNQKIAMDLAAFLSSEESQLMRFEKNGITPAHKNLENHPAVQASERARTEIAVVNTCSITQPFIAEMSAFWMPVCNFGSDLVRGTIDLYSYRDYVDKLASQVNEDM